MTLSDGSMQGQELLERNDQRKLLACALVVAGLVYVYPLTLGTPLIDPDEGLHAAIAQEMVDSGDYVVPRLVTTPFLDKPILFTAAQAVSLRVFGMTEWAVRLPGYAFALLGVWTTALLAGRLFDKSTALVSALMSLTMVVPMSVAQAPIHDVALVPWTNGILLCCWHLTETARPENQLRWHVVLSVLVALAVLTKGLIGLCVVGIGFGAFALWNGRASRLLGPGLGVLAGAVIAAPWFLAMEHVHPGYLSYYFIERHIGGFATSHYKHGNEPWHYYLPYLVLGSMPWIWYSVAGAVDAVSDSARKRKPTDQRSSSELQAESVGSTAQRNERQWFLACWLLCGLLFLSVARSKLATYALPLFPPIAIAGAAGWIRFANGQLRLSSTRILMLLIQNGCLLGTVLPFAILVAAGNLLQTEYSIRAWLAAAAVSVLAILSLTLLRWNRYAESLAAGTLWLATLFVLLGTWPLQEVAELHSGRALAEMLNNRSHFPREVHVVGRRIGSVVFYLRPELRSRLRPRQIRQSNPKRLEEWQLLPSDSVLAIERSGDFQLQNPIFRENEHLTVGPFRVMDTQTTGEPTAAAEDADSRTF